MTKQETVAFSKDGEIQKLILENSFLHVEVSALGATLVSLRLLKTKDQRDVVCGLNSAEEYLAHDKYFGACVGRVAGRIDKGQFQINGEQYSLACNNNGNALHGGIHGFNQQTFTYQFLPINKEELGVKLYYTSEDGEEGYPGTLALEVTYFLSENTLRIEYSATTTKDTLVNLTNHSYFNLEGHASESVGNHILQVEAKGLLKIDEDSCPRGAILNLEGTPFDFRKAKSVNDCLHGNHEQLELARGIDHYFIFNKPSNQMKLQGGDKVCTMVVSTNQRGANIYTANYLDGQLVGKENVAYPKQCAICLETQDLGNEVNIHENPTTILRVGDTYEAYTEFIFEVEE